MSTGNGTFGLRAVAACLGAISCLPGPLLSLDELDPKRLGWSQLTFQTSKLFLTAQAEVEIERRSPAELTAELVPSEVEGELPAVQGAVLLHVRSSLFGRHSHSRLWLDSRDGRAWQRIEVNTGRRPRRKIYRHGLRGVAAQRTVPVGATEAGSPPESWTGTSSSVYAYPGEHGGPVTEPGALFYLLSVLDPGCLDGGLSLDVFSDRRLVQMEVQSVGRQPIRIDYLEDRGGKVGRRKEEIEAIRVAVRGVADGGEAELELLGLQGDIEIFLDPVTRIPLRVTGKIPPLGRVVVRLKEAKLLAAADSPSVGTH